MCCGEKSQEKDGQRNRFRKREGKQTGTRDSKPAKGKKQPTHLRRIYTTLILGTALLNFGTRTNNIGHGTLDFCRVKANFSACVPKNLGGPRPPQEVVPARLKRGPRAETRGNLVPRVFAVATLPRKRRLWGRK